VSGDAPVSAYGAGRPPPAPRLVAIRHRALRVSAPTDEPAGAGGGLRLDLPATVLTAVDLGAQAAPGGGGRAVSGHGVPLQEIQLAVEIPDPKPAHARGLEPARRADAPAPPALPRPAPA